MSTKVQAVVAGAFAALTGYIAYFVALPPNLQTGTLGELIAVAPAAWQPALAATSKTLSVFLGLYATYNKAAHSGPQTPPQNPPQ